MEKPQRIQLKRTKGWRMPDNTVKVDRTSKWGNPFSVDDAPPSLKTKEERQGWAVGMFNLRVVKNPEVFRELRGKNLACWCKPGSPCHADVLLDLANEG